MTEALTTRDGVAKLVDHTLLKPEATATDVAALCADATALGVFAVCLSPSRLPLPAGLLAPGIAVATVCGFPSGAHHAAVKAAEAAASVEDGADEIDMVLDLGLVKDRNWTGVTAEI